MIIRDSRHVSSTVTFMLMTVTFVRGNCHVYINQVELRGLY